MLTASVTSWIVAKLASCSLLVVMPGLHLTSTLVFHQTESSSSRRPTRSESRAGTLKRRSGSQVGASQLITLRFLLSTLDLCPRQMRRYSVVIAVIFCDVNSVKRITLISKQIVLKDCLYGKCAWRFKLNTDQFSFSFLFFSVAKDFCTISQFPIECLRNVSRWLTVTANSVFFSSNAWLNSKKN